MSSTPSKEGRCHDISGQWCAARNQKAVSLKLPVAVEADERRNLRSISKLLFAGVSSGVSPGSCDSKLHRQISSPWVHRPRSRWRFLLIIGLYSFRWCAAAVFEWVFSHLRRPQCRCNARLILAEGDFGGLAEGRMMCLIDLGK